MENIGSGCVIDIVREKTKKNKKVNKLYIDALVCCVNYVFTHK